MRTSKKAKKKGYNNDLSIKQSKSFFKKHVNFKIPQMSL